ncbi:MAG: hypothetical protein KJI71_05570 [Patescibacteria group bacterium]|nr:hypothetical protein [Patescibacteria group bacterium]
MRNYNYRKICSNLLSDLTDRQKEIILRRFGLRKEEKETLESIGKDLGVSRERIRQIQQVGLESIGPKTVKYKEIFQLFIKHFKKCGGLRKEDVLLEELGGKERNEIHFLLNLEQPFQRFNENNDFYSLWTINHDSFVLAKRAINLIYNQLKKEGKPLSLKGLNCPLSLKQKMLVSYLETSKRIQKNQEGLYGLSDWPEINPKGIKDRAYLVFKEVQKPLHFTRVANLIKDSHLQTVHNELIKDQRFILVGRGIYALSEWGYYAGQVKDVILKILQKAEKPLDKEKILSEVLKQRMVKENTVLLNLSDKRHFLRDSKGRYSVKEI